MVWCISKRRRTSYNIPDNIFNVSTGCDDKESPDENAEDDEVVRQEFDEVDPLNHINNKKPKPDTKTKKTRKNEN